MKPLIGVLHTRNLSSAAWILISCAMVQIRMRVLQPVQKCLVLFCKMQSLNFTVTKLDQHVDYLHYSGVALFLIFTAFTHFLKWLFYVLYFLTASVGKIWEPSGGQNNICKSHSALSTSAWFSGRVKLCLSCIIYMFHHLFIFLSVYLCT